MSTTRPTDSTVGPSQAKAKVLVVDDHAVVRQGLTQLINREKDMCVCGDAETAAEALKMMAATHPDVAIVDVSLKEDSGLDLVKDVKIRFPKLPVLVLSMHDETFYAERFLRAGARGYIMKEVATEKVMTAIRRVLAGEVYLSERMSSRILHKLVDGPARQGGSALDALSDRELEVFRLIGTGLGTRDIAKRLHVSVKTVEAHRAHIKDKLKLDTATELLQHAIQWMQDSESA
ncbi:MAG: response regulator transcription factor [Phycisphaerae bacterium]|nr:response regulator transcription factor [Phycisphaerae bacterium]